MMLSPFLLAFFFSISTSFEINMRDHGCSDFNKGASLAASAGIQNVFVCPPDGISRKICADSYHLRNVSEVVQSELSYSDIIIYLMIGPHSKTDALLWWLRLLTESDQADIVIIADSCADETLTCSDWATETVNKIQENFLDHHFHLVRSLAGDSGYKTLSCKLRTGASLIYKMFPEKKIYLKIDTDTIIFPKRLLNFLHTLDAVTPTDKPLYFGTVVESGSELLLCGREWTESGDVSRGGLCYGQGGAGYGLNNVGMKTLSQSPSCNSSFIDITPEDTYTALRMYDTSKTLVVHCGGFSSSEIMTPLRMRSSISFHYVDTKFLKTHGDALLKHLHSNEQTRRSRLRS